MKKKIFYLNLNMVHEAGSRSIHHFNKKDVHWFDTIEKPEADVHWTLFDVNNYNKYMSTNESAKPLFDYYKNHKKFDVEEIEKLYKGIDVTLNVGRLAYLIDKVDKNIEYVKNIKPDIILVRFYSYYEFLLLYFLDQVKDMPAFKSIGGADLNFNNWYYIDYFLDNQYIDNFHDGYGERHVQKIIYSPEQINKKTTDYEYNKDEFSIPDKDVHWIINTLMCNGSCSFCVHNRNAKLLIKPKVNFISDEYIQFILGRLKYYQDNNVSQVFVPGSITFYNKAHLKKFYYAYKEANLHIKFVDAYFKFDDLDAETIKMIEEMNFHSIKLGLESINKHLRVQVGKNYNTELVYESTRLLQETKVNFKYSFIYNFPFSGYTDLMNDYNFIHEFDLKYFSFNRFELYNDTPMELTPQNYNMTKKINANGYIFYERTTDLINNKVYSIIDNNIKNYLIDNKDATRAYYNNFIKRDDL